MKISIRHIADHGTIAAAIEAIAADHDSIASGMTRPTDMPCRNWREAKAKLHAIRLQVRTGEPFFFATGITVLRHHAGQCISVMRGALRECRDRRMSLSYNG